MDPFTKHPYRQEPWEIDTCRCGLTKNHPIHKVE